MAGESTPESIGRAEIAVAGWSVATAVVLMAMKFVAYALTGSAAVFSDALESIVNVLAGGFALYAIVLAHRPPDAEHPYGHGKVEFLSAGFEGGMILLAALVILSRAVESLAGDTQLQRLDAGLILVVTALLVNGGLGLWLIRRGRRHGSLTLEADGLHLLSDAVTSVAVVAALMIVRLTGWSIVDPIVAILVAVYIAFTGLRLLKRSAAGLMDAQDAEDNALIRKILDAHLPRGTATGACSYHKLRHRHSGRYHWVDFHLVVPADWDIRRGHDLASRIEYEIEQALVFGDATAHVEPCDDPKCSACDSTRSSTGTMKEAP